MSSLWKSSGSEITYVENEFGCWEGSWIVDEDVETEVSKRKCSDNIDDWYQHVYEQNRRYESGGVDVLDDLEPSGEVDLNPETPTRYSLISSDLAFLSHLLSLRLLTYLTICRRIRARIARVKQKM